MRVNLFVAMSHKVNALEELVKCINMFPASGVLWFAFEKPFIFVMFIRT